ncbi:MAG: O-antigen ligase family protein [Candidatus Izemoplasmataceae bacterium]
MAKYGKKNRKSKAFKNQKSLSTVYLLPVLFIIAIVPLIVFAKVVEIDGLESANWSGGTVHFDFFSYYKSIYFIVASYIGALILLILYWLDRLDFVKTKYYKPMAIYAIFVFISFVFAKDIDVALRGFIEMFQGIFVLLGYLLLMITIINLVKEEKHVKAIVGAFLFVGTIIGLIGAGQYFGHDIFRTSFGQLLILPKELHPLAEDLTFSFADFAVYATLYNTNFVGSFAALMIPLSFALYFYQKKIGYAFLSILFVGLMVFVGFGSNSRAGIIGVFAALLLIAILFRKEVLRKPLYIVIPFIALIIIGYGLNEVSDGRIVNEFKSLNLFDDIRRAEEISDSRAYFEELNFDDYSLEIVTDEESLRIEFIDNDLFFEDLEGNKIDVLREGRRITFVDERYQNFVFTRSIDGAYYIVNAYGRSFNIWLTIDGFRFEGLNGGLNLPSEPDRLKFFDGYESLFSSRAYIWSRSIPLLKKFIIIGAGPDMYPVAFPQDDYVGRLNATYLGIVVDKPHNMYVQMGVNTGLISLVAMISIFGMYIIDSIKLFINRQFNSLYDYIGVGLFASVTAYLVSGFFNDQIISVAPLFYAMLALGIVVNKKIHKDEK